MESNQFEVPIDTRNRNSFEEVVPSITDRAIGPAVRCPSCGITNLRRARVSRRAHAIAGIRRAIAAPPPPQRHPPHLRARLFGPTPPFLDQAPEKAIQIW